MPLNDIVNVQITAQTQSLPEQNFGIPLILGANKSFNDLVRQYSSISDVAVDFSPQSQEYIAAQAVFSQNPRPTSLFIGRRDVPIATLNVTSAMFNQTYTNTINGISVEVESNDLQQTSKITWSGPFVSGNVINVVFDDTVLGTINSVIDFDIDFVALNSIVARVNGVDLAPVVFSVDQATTLGLLATALSGATGVASATATGARQITVVFTDPGENSVDSVITTLGASQPTATISQGGFVFTGSHAATIGAIATYIETNFPSTVDSAVAAGNVITVTSIAGTMNQFNASTVYLGASQATATFDNDSLKEVIGRAMASAIVAETIPGVTSAYTGTPDGTYTVSATGPDFDPFTLKASTDIVATNEAIIKITDAQPSAIYNLYLAGIQFQYAASNTVETVENIAAAFVAQINQYSTDHPVGFSATDNLDGSFTVTRSAPNTFFVQITDGLMAKVIGINILPYVPQGLVTDRLNEILDVTDQWYGLILTDRTLATVKLVATWAEDHTVIFGTASNDPVIIDSAVGVDTTSIAWFINNNGYVRSFVLYHQDADSEYPEAAWFGKVLPLTPGSETWKFKTLAGVTYSKLTTTQSNNALNKKANTYEYIGGVGITQNGTSGQGEFIDIVRGIDWLKSTIQTYVYRTLVTLPKVPYTDAGIAAIQSQVQKALQQGIDNDFIADNPPPVVTVPLAADVPLVDKANRILKNVKFTATLAGAIHAVQIQGVVTV